MCQRKTKQMREFEPILKANGYREIRSNGSHFIYSNGNNKITVNSYFASIANKYLSDKGSTILGESVNTELVDGLVKVNAKIKTTEGTWKTFSAKIDADGNMFERKFRTITKGVDKLETALKNFSRETSPALTYQETLDKANEIKQKELFAYNFDRIKADIFAIRALHIDALETLCDIAENTEGVELDD